MSVVLNGNLHEIDQLIKFLHNYKKICTVGSALESLDVLTCSSVLCISNKYYSADLTLHTVALAELPDDELITKTEGYILIASGEEDLSHERHKLSRRMIEMDTGLRLLVTFTVVDDTVSPTSKRYQEWALDNGFEYIEIDMENLTASHTDREKYGLPRLMEALESNMWSTMQRHADGTAVRRSVSNGTASSSNGSSSGSSSSRADLATTATTASEAGPVDSSMSCEPLLSKTADACADGGVSQQQAQQQVPQVDPFSEEMVDSEDNEIIDKFANFISEAQQFRQQALSGGVSDEARRERAAAMALQLSQLMDLDEDSD